MSNSKDQGTMTVDGPSSTPGSESPRGNNGGAGNSGSNKGNTKNYSGISKTAGDALAQLCGLNPTDFISYYVREDGDVIGIASASAPVKPTVDGYVVGVNLGPLPASISGGNNKDEGTGATVSKQIINEVINFNGDISDARIAALNKIIAENAWMVSSGQAGQRITRAKQATRAAQAELALINNVREKQAAEARAKAEAEAQRKQAEWDATHQVEAAQRNAEAALANLNKTRNDVNNAQNAVNAANANIAPKTAEYNAAREKYEITMQNVKRFSVFANQPAMPGYRTFLELGNIALRDRNDMNARKEQLDAAKSQLNAANENLNNANSALATAQHNQIHADNTLADATARRDATERENAARRAAEEKARKEQEDMARQREKEAEEKSSNEKEVLIKASELVADMGDKLGEYLGDKFKAIAKEIADDIKNFQGKTLRSYDDAVDSLNKITANPAMKINKADKIAIVNAWRSLDAQDMANKIGNLGKAFKVADVAMKIEKFREKCIEGYTTGNWAPLMLEVESWVLSGMAASVAMALLGGVLSLFSPVGVPITAVTIVLIMLISILASKIDAEMAERINNQVIKMVK
ncbi:colicin-like pore-forming protein [Erwinia sp. QL-Z3]|uniref:colicin-like pore-forming protein n=1 Tax=Erwinia sp. QL-Z3 TaxID=2547962 RepID=UPI0027380FDE|nr:colicin-like pore-forming protein [Erwinia sp. QL-Z3]